jgi:hypothetical protein
MQEVVDEVRQAMAARMHASVKQLRGQHRIHQPSLDLQPGLPEKLQIKFRIVEDCDEGWLCQKSPEWVPCALRDLPEVQHQDGPAWSGELE